MNPGLLGKWNVFGQKILASFEIEKNGTTAKFLLGMLFYFKIIFQHEIFYFKQLIVSKYIFF